MQFTFNLQEEKILLKLCFPHNLILRKAYRNSNKQTFFFHYHAITDRQRVVLLLFISPTYGSLQLNSARGGGTPPFSHYSCLIVQYLFSDMWSKLQLICQHYSPIQVHYIPGRFLVLFLIILIMGFAFFTTTTHWVDMST